MSKAEYTTDVGDFLVIWLTCHLNKYIAQVVQTDPLRLKVQESGPYANLKDGDFGIMAQESEMLQLDVKNDTCIFLNQEQTAGRKVYSGLIAVNVIDNRLHEILPG